MRQSIRGYADGVIEQEAGSGRLPLTASELGSVGDLIAGSADLRRVLLDPGVPLLARRNVVRDLFSPRVDAPTLRLLVFAVDADRAPGLVDNIAWLAARMDAAARELVPTGHAVLGRRAAEERVDGYATAVLESLESQASLARVQDELFRFHQIVGGSEELGTALSSRDLDGDVRAKIVVDLLEGRSDPTTVRLAAYATHIGRSRDYHNLLAHLVDRVAAERNRRLADVRSAVELDDSQQADLASALGRVVGHEVEVRVTVDPYVLAGFVATVGDTVVDGSARHRLELLKDRLVMPEVTMSTGEPSDG